MRDSLGFIARNVSLKKQFVFSSFVHLWIDIIHVISLRWFIVFLFLKVCFILTNSADTASYLGLHYLPVYRTCGPRGGGRGSVSPEKSQNMGFLSNNSTNPLKITKLLSQYSMLGHHRNASETPFRWRADDGPLIVVFRSSLPS